MHRFFADEKGIVDGLASLEATDAHHALKVLRMNPGDEAALIHGGQLYRCAIQTMSASEVTARVLETLPSPEPKLKITLYQGLPKADKMDWIVQKATELGVSRIVPMAMDRCVVKLDAKDGAKKQERWQKIAREAAKQSGRALVPQIAPLQKSPEFKEDLLLVPWEEAQGYNLAKAHSQHPDVHSIGILIGPEGGIARSEIAALPFAPVTLGPRILRTETAGLCAISALYALYGDLE